MTANESAMAPDRNEMLALLSLFNQGRLAEAEIAARAMTNRFPAASFGWKVLGAVLKQSGRSEAALEPMRKAAELSPADPDAFCNLGLILHDLGRFDEAESCCRRAIEINPDFAVAHYNLGNVLKEAGRLQESEASFRRAIEIRPDYAEAHCNLGFVLNERDLHAEAESCYRKAIEIMPSHVGAHYNLGATLHAEGKRDEAVAAYRRALAIDPDLVEIHYNLGITLHELGRLSEAEESFRRAIAIDPMHAGAYNNLGATLMDEERLVDAEISIQKAIELRPGFSDAYCNLGNVQYKSGHVFESLASFGRAIEINPESAEAYNNLGATQLELLQVQEAEASFRKAIAIRPDFSEAHANLGNVLKDLGRIAESVAAYRRAIEIDPEFAEAHSNLSIALCHLGDVKGGMQAAFRALEIEPDNSNALGNVIFFMDLLPGFDTEAQQSERKKWAALHADPLLPNRQYANSPDPDRKLKIGYVSADFNDHSAASGFASLLGNFDRAHFEVHAYANSRKNDQVTEALRRNVSGWRDIAGKPDAEVAELVMRDSIDILVDLSGHTGGNRLTLFALKPAPIQVSAMGYPNGTGMKAMDALFVDQVVVPPNEKRHYVEEIRYLPSVIAFSTPKVFPEVNPLPALNSQAVTFGSFNRLPKISTETLELWARILKELPASNMLFKATEFDDELTRKQVLRHFENAGVRGDRISFLGKSSWVEHVRAYNLVDIALDPFPHGGGVTTLESIRMGVPVLTLRYPTFAGRASASILTTLGLTDWIAESAEDYVRIAIEKSGNLGALSDLRKNLRDTYASSILGAPDHYLHAAEKEYRALWRRWCDTQSQCA